MTDPTKKLPTLAELRANISDASDAYHMNDRRTPEYGQRLFDNITAAWDAYDQALIASQAEEIARLTAENERIIRDGILAADEATMRKLVGDEKFDADAACGKIIAKCVIAESKVETLTAENAELRKIETRLQRGAAKLRKELLFESAIAIEEILSGYPSTALEGQD
jgi:cell division protein FtsB